MSFWNTVGTIVFPVPYLANKAVAMAVSKKTTTPTTNSVANTSGSNYVTAADPNTAQTSVNINSDRNDILLIGGLAVAGVVIAVLLSPKQSNSSSVPRPPE